MKLVQKLTLFYLLLSLVVLSLGGVFYYITFTQLIDKETDYELNGEVGRLSKFIEKGIPYDSLTDQRVQISLIVDSADMHHSRAFKDTTAYHGPSKAIIHHRKIKKTVQINQDWYHFQIYESVIEPLDTFYGTFKATLVVSIALILFSLIYSFFVSKWLLQPFHKALKLIQNFNVQTSTPIVTEPASTSEFKKLNDFIENMTHRTVTDYNNLKEFSENIAHEIRTPLAIASGKLDLLMQNSELSEQQIDWTIQSQKALNKVSKIQQSLVTLSRIENKEFNHIADIQLSHMIRHICEENADIFELRHIHIETELATDTVIQNDPVLIEILLTNLLQNAIKHNLSTAGNITISLSHTKLKITNSGYDLHATTEILMQRFKKDSTNNDSIGLGLSIIKKICDLSNYGFDYSFDQSLKQHEITIELS